jgi:hypothetical protein
MALNNKAVLTLAALALLGLTSGRPAAAQKYDASADFSTTNDPSPFNGGVWSYGYEDILGTGFVLDPSNSPQTLSFNSAIQGWAAGTGGYSYVAQNTSAVAVSYVDVTLQPGQIVMHPDATGQYSVVRFTAPTTGDYTLDTAFSGLDTTPTTTDVHVLLDGSSLFDGAVDSYEIPQAYSSSLSLSAGDTVDFAVGDGSNKNYFNDSTGLTATLATTPNAVPESSPLALIALGILPVLLSARRKCHCLGDSA